MFRPLTTILFLLIFLSVSPTYSQQQMADSLKMLIEKDNSGLKSLPWYFEIGRQYYLLGKQDSGLVYFKRGMELAKSKQEKEWYSKIGLRTGGLYAMMSMEDSANKYLELANPYKMAISNDTLLSFYNNFKGIVSIYQDDYVTGMSYILKSIEVLERMGDKRMPGSLIQNYVNLLICLKGEKQYGQAEKYLQKMISQIDYSKDPPQLGLLYYNAASLYLESKNTAKFKQFLDSASFYNKQYPNYGIEVNLKGAYAEYYFSKKDYKQSYTSYLETYKALKDNNQTFDIPLVAMGIAQSLSHLGKWEEGIRYYQEAIELATQTKSYRTLAEAYRQLKELYAQNSQFQKAHEFGLLHMQFQDSVSTIDSKKSVQVLEARFQSEKKEKEISELNLANQAKELEVIKSNRLLTIGGTASLSLFLILGLFYRNAKQKQIIAEKDQKLKQDQIRFLERQQQVVSLQSMVNGQETERTRIAKDLHDGLGGLFSTIKMHFSTLQHEQPALKEDALFSKSYEMVNTASEEVRRIAHNMMPEVLIKLGLIQATQDLCNSISAGKLLQASLQVYGMDERLSPSTEIMLFRILQELLNNIIKHSGATQAIIQFNRESNRLSVTVEDNGKGFNAAESDGMSHAGLSSVESRVNYLNGKLSIDSQKEVGTTVMMDFLIHE